MLLWSEAELDAVWRHQLAAPVEGWSAGAPPHAVTCGELLHGPGLEAEGLGLLKDFAKLNRDHPGSALPPDLATVLYLAAIAAAFVRLDRRLSSLSDEALKLGWQWAASRPWLDEGTRSLMSSAVTKLGGLSASA